MQTIFTLTVPEDPSNFPHGHAELTQAEAWALARFVKRAGWDEMQGNAVDDAEADQIRSGHSTLPGQIRATSLGYIGFTLARRPY
ncbi:hypothetical protein IQ288_19490 [Burkholderia sp. R-69980]|nr:hypothetical protein [Burkholderia sp. R-69980]